VLAIRLRQSTVTAGELTLARVRRWRKKLLDTGTSPITTAKAYRFLRARHEHRR
jgi:hypothetical protein